MRGGGLLAFETWMLPSQQRLYRGGAEPSHLPFVFLSGEMQWGRKYLERAHNLGEEGRPSVQEYRSLKPLALFVMSMTNLRKLLYRCDISDLLRQVIVHVTGSHLNRGATYERHSVTARGTGVPMVKTVGKRRLQVHTHNYITSANESTNTYAALKLAQEMRKYLMPLNFDGWVYSSEDVPRASTNTSVNAPLLFFHQEFLFGTILK